MGKLLTAVLPSGQKHGLPPKGDVIIFTIIFNTKCWAKSINLLIYSIHRVLLEKLTGPQLVKKFPAYYGTQRLITASQVPAICPIPEADRSSPCPHIPLPEYPS